MVSRTCEPSRGAVGRQIRSWLGVDTDSPSAPSLALLFAADRLEHLRKEIIPALEEGQVVLCDRYVWSSFAYQGLDCELSWVRQLNAKALAPDLALWLEVPVKTALGRSAARLAKGAAAPELFDAADLQHRLHAAYSSFAGDPQDSLLAVDADRSVEELSAALLTHCDDIGL